MQHMHSLISNTSILAYKLHLLQAREREEAPLRTYRWRETQLASEGLRATSGLLRLHRAHPPLCSQRGHVIHRHVETWTDEFFEEITIGVLAWPRFRGHKKK